MRLILSLCLVYLLSCTELSAQQRRGVSYWSLDSKANKNSIESSHIKYNKISYTPKVALIDTGVDVANPFIASNIIKRGVDFSRPNKSAPLLKDEHGHGTHLAGIMKAVFPDIKIKPLDFNLRLLNCPGNYWMFKRYVFGHVKSGHKTGYGFSSKKPHYLII